MVEKFIQLHLLMGSFKKSDFSTHNNTIAIHGCIKIMMQGMVEKIV